MVETRSRKMSEVAPMGNGSGRQFFSQDERNSHYYRKTPFFVVDCQYRDKGTYGPNWLVTLAEQETGESKNMSFTDNEYRRKQFEQVQIALKGGDMVGPVILNKAKTKNGKTAWELIDAPDENDEVPF